jgi:GR25 family glycosyltransferase involved in LPS biosynthesis
MNILKLFINIDRSKDRLDFIKDIFMPNKIKKFEGIDGLMFSDGTYDKLGRPNWSKRIFNNFREKGILIEKNNFKEFLYPTELGCTLSHIETWKFFLKKNIEYSHLMVFEDDIKPTEIAKNKLFEDIINMKDSDILYLFGPNHIGKRLNLYDNGEVKEVRSHMGYIMTRKGAQLAIEAMKPIYEQSDSQIFKRLARSVRNKYKNKYPMKKLSNLPTIKISGLFNPLIEHSHFAKRTTFTNNGKKLYIPTKWNIV